MSTIRTQEAAEGAEKVLSEVFGEKVRIGTTKHIGGNRSAVFRCTALDGSDEVPAGVVVKQAIPQKGEIYGPDSPEGPSWRLFNEWAGLQFVSEVCGSVRIAPRFYGGDTDAGIIVMEDLGDRQEVADFLLGNDPVTASNALVEFWKALGRLHRLTIDKDVEYHRFRSALGPARQPTDSTSERCQRSVQKRLEALDLIGVKPHPGFTNEVEAQLMDYYEPENFFAYLHEPCPNNGLEVNSKIMLVDFEFGRFGHALVDNAVYLRMLFPSCLCVNRIPEEIVDSVEEAYRLELMKGCPAVADDTQFYQGIVEACAWWAFHMLAWSLPDMLEQDHLMKWNMATHRQCLLTRFDILVKAIEEFGYLPAVGATACEVVGTLSRLWSEVGEMAYYPAFR